jgi:hypothetical protein
MMDEATAELLSRLLDGDLDDVERRELEARLDREPGLRSELDSLRRLQAATRAVAERMEPPVELDDAVEQLGAGAVAMPRRRASSVVRWLGVAAGLALAATVVLEVARRSPEPTLAPATPTQDLGRETPRAEAPRPMLQGTNEQPRADVISEPELDSSAASPGAPHPAPAAEEKRRVDAPERPAELPRESELDAAEPLRERALRPFEDAQVTAEIGDEATEPGREERPPGPAKGSDAGPPAVGSMKRSLPPGAAAASSVAGKKVEGTTETVRLELRDEDGVPVATIRLREPWDRPGTPLWVSVTDGIIVAIDGRQDAQTDTASDEWRRSSLLGVALEGVPDGQYLVVEADGSAP